ncbi:glyoxalase/bleomycin resistance/dioxygenase family protein [Christiangramia fulva]|uniref:Glyoxalase/bleomycin resistance/dioxygenase family protein n=1 Tax=Christiangramia fulva TaxID=2126553 RepID=A0A2R3Z4I3_9FLAO|nr:ArsI/CadI family heavy metal resistance metalloenzyme [Christiangramia fulva]AVR45144.1 glyoxalase/bleomycin resistance/dioxygenase family protein [Christiangramia fulva]
MKTFHVHIKVKDLEENIAFYSALFGTEPSVVKSDYAKWMLNDPKVNFAISQNENDNGIEHLGIQTGSREELQEVYGNLEKAKGVIFEEGECSCCYAKSEKSWIKDPQGVEWEAFYTFGETTVYGEGRNAKQVEEESEEPKREASVKAETTCDGSCAVG